ADAARVELVELLSRIGSPRAMRSLIRLAAGNDPPAQRARKESLAFDGAVPLALRPEQGPDLLVLDPGTRRGRAHVVGAIGRPLGPKGDRFAWSASTATRFAFWVHPRDLAELQSGLHLTTSSSADDA